MTDRFCLLTALILIFSILSPFNGVEAVPISRVSPKNPSHVPNGLMKPRYILPASTNKSSSDCEVIVETVENHPVSTPYVVVVKGSPGLVGFVRLMYDDLRDIPGAISIQIHIGDSVLDPFFVVFVLIACLGFVSGPENKNDHELEDHDCYACNHRDLEDKWDILCPAPERVVAKDGKMLHVDGITFYRARVRSIGCNVPVTWSSHEVFKLLDIHQRSGDGKERALLVRPVKACKLMPLLSLDGVHYFLTTVPGPVS
ncbi:hypothetical protein F5876DRAFT_64978 [Lentinula aff. lateritia]|uniref:Uncharacterized protein n=1 Tax=Lentinula aff. lateritia TaxID=2804960 RepID=A0ACC1U2C7_9AGAR|nr:hypothetical protein F5876DRAFT_64978 [Lentinula aff. lateritia]